MSKKAVSQKIARAFEIIDYILLIPSFIGLYFGLIMLSDGQSFMLGLGIIAVILIGITLLIGYFKHSRGSLSAGGVRALWIGTILLNGSFLAPSLYFTFYNAAENTSQKNLGEIIFSPPAWLFVWWMIAVSGAIIALCDNKGKTKLI